MSSRSAFFFATGLGVLALNKARYFVRGYTRPRSFEATDIPRCLNYDAEVVAHWEKHLRAYTGREDVFAGRRILELGPGADIGVGAFLVDHGAEGYWAIDKHDLMRQMPSEFVPALRARLHTQRARVALEEFFDGRGDLHYIVDDQFDVTRLADAGIDMIVSQAAMEHFDCVADTFAQLSELATPGTVLCAEVDLQTHSRWIRERDPNNIYRFPEWLYRTMRYAGIPNRVRPEEYRDHLAAGGWTNIEVVPLRAAVPTENPATLVGLSKRFRASDMRTLTCLLLATKA